MENKVSGATVKNRKEGRKDAGRDFVRKLKLKATERERGANPIYSGFIASQNAEWDGGERLCER